MTSSPERDDPVVRDELPPALSSMWRLLQARLPPRAAPAARRRSGCRCWRRCPTRCSRCGSSCSADGVLRRQPRCSCTRRRSASACRRPRTWFLRTVSDRAQRRFRDRGDDRARGARRASCRRRSRRIAHHERPDYLEPARGAPRSGLRARSHVHVAVLHVRLDPAARRHGRAADVDSSGAGAAGAVRAADRADLDMAARRRARRAGARRARRTGWPGTCSPPPRPRHPGKEVRVTGIGDRLVDERRAAWERWHGPVAARARGGRRAWHTLAWAIFGAALRRRAVVSSRSARVAAGDVLLVLAAGSRLSAYIGATVGEIGFLRGIWIDGSRRLAWLEDYAASLTAAADAPVPGRAAPTASASSTSSFAYPGTDRARARRRDPRSASRRGRRDRRRERRRQDHAGQAARARLYRADQRTRSLVDGADSRACRADAVARAPRRRVPGLLPLRVPRAPQRSASATCRASTTSRRS